MKDRKLLAMFFNGSPRKGWNTAKALESAAEGAREAGAETEIVNLYDFSFTGCKSCFACKLKNAKTNGVCEPERLLPLYEKYRGTYHCVYQRDIYSGAQWLEIMPQEATKANAIRQLKALLHCERLVVFGDGRNDIDMFQLADESYAVENADDELKQLAAAVIPSNDADGVAHWLEQHAPEELK